MLDPPIRAIVPIGETTCERIPAELSISCSPDYAHDSGERSLRGVVPSLHPVELFGCLCVVPGVLTSDGQTQSMSTLSASPQKVKSHTYLLPLYVPTCLKCAISPCIFLLRSVSINSPSRGSRAVLCAVALLGPAPGVDNGVSAGRAEVDGDDRKADKDVICGSVRSWTRVDRGIDSLARRWDEVGWDMP